ncbi:MAG: hypothetical protein IJ093_02195, partial [Bacilli bacterium]|nr:hypothetical protein [Bacilli bacterium]
MKIYLFYPEEIFSFILPKDVDGSYSFDVDKNEESKLINVEARNGQWVIYSIEGVNLVNGNMFTDSYPLTHDTFYVINRNNKNYLVYAADVLKDKLFTYSCEENLSMVIGNTNTANIKYPCQLLGANEVKIQKQGNGFVLEQPKDCVAYLNNKRVVEKQRFLKIGDSINIYGLKIILLNNLILLNNPGNKLIMPNLNFGIKLYIPKDEEEDKTIQVKDRDLYDKKDYFSKSPRLRRIIETKKIKLSPPPQRG